MVMKFDTPKIKGEYDTMSDKKFPEDVAFSAQVALCYDHVSYHVAMTLCCRDVTDLARTLEITADNVPDFRRAMIVAAKIMEDKIKKGQIK